MDPITYTQFIQSQVDNATSKADLRTKIGNAINALNSFAGALDSQLATAPTQFAAADPDFTSFLEALPTPEIPT
jgi:hypothetical protein